MLASTFEWLYSAFPKLYESLSSNATVKRRHLSSKSDNQQASISEKKHHSKLWDCHVGYMLSSMMKLAGYAEESQAVHSAFFRNSVAPSLGPYPLEGRSTDIWKSFMTDDHTPLELSWSWSDKKATPVVRYAAEPIGWLAGTASDPFNNKATKVCLGETLPLAPNLDLQWYRYFLKALTTNGEHQTQLAIATNPPSQTFIAFDLEKHTMTVKYYFLPALKAFSLGKSKLELVEEAIVGLPSQGSSFQPSLLVLTDYIRSHDLQDQPQVEIFAVDCVDTVDSRLKIYIRSKNTSFNNMVDVMTLGGRLPAFSENVRLSLEELWCQCFGIKNTTEALSAPLKEKNHRTGGLLYYLELKASSPHPTSKVYLPVRHYGQGDDQIARGLSNFLNQRGKHLVGGLSYYEGVTRLCVDQFLPKSELTLQFEAIIGGWMKDWGFRHTSPVR